ncbi:rubrerythrin family protein [Desulfogranum marinum]|uniref:rubrerythrin family protein n=1 Tax=Desulfogranum marinum TaxID=453220 RepID=UPI001964D6C3|nr:rubrerythrin family protein [Desulfogranum marinum]MBM9511961.1 rubrerythrin family protein [Desulfogranum marinum]
MEEQLLNLYAQLIKEATRLEVYTIRAEKDQRPELAQMYKALTLSHRAQARRILLQVRGFISHSDENLSLVIDEELPGFLTKYERCHQLAVEANNKAVATGCDHALRITQINLQLAKRAQEERQLPDTFFICDFCGFIASAKLPEACPICTAAARRFKKVC